MSAQDPAEQFDLCDADGRPLGVSKPRALVHRDGDWHRSLHLWVLLSDPASTSSLPELLLQRRSLAKDTQPGAVDIAVAGHLAAGETVEDALREAEEEIGLVVQPTQIARLGVRRRVFAHPPVQDREIQEVYLTVTSRSLESLAPNADEVQGLLAVPLEAALALCNEEIDRVDARELPAAGSAVRPALLLGSELLQDRDGYFAVALGLIARRLAGEPSPAFRLGFGQDGDSRPSW